MNLHFVDPSPAAASVRHYLPGGTENGGGIGRLVGYIVGEADGHDVTDTRGPKLSPASLFRLAGALAVMARDRVREPERVHHIHVAGRGSTARKLVLTGVASLLRCTYILHLHDYDYGYDIARRPAWQQRLVAGMFRRAERVVALGRRDRETIVRLLGVAPERVVVMHNAVADPGPPPPRRRAETELRTILFLGRLGARKGTPELLAALASPAMAGLPWRAVLAGDGEVEASRRQAEELGIGDRVALPGWLDAEKTQALLAAADILTLPSHAEGMAMAVLEGLAHGLPVVATDVGAHGEAIVPGRSGVFVPVGDSAALAAALAELVRDGKLRARLSAGAREKFVQEFSMGAYMADLGRLYAAVGRRQVRLVAA